MAELMKQVNLEGAAEQQRWQGIQRDFESEQRRLTEATTQHDALAASLYARQLEYMKECIAESIRLGRLLVPALVAVRAELDLPITESTYMQVIEEGIKKQEVSLSAFLKDVQRFIAAQPGAPGDAPQAARP